MDFDEHVFMEASQIHVISRTSLKGIYHEPNKAGRCLQALHLILRATPFLSPRTDIWQHLIFLWCVHSVMFWLILAISWAATEDLDPQATGEATLGQLWGVFEKS